MVDRKKETLDRELETRETETRPRTWQPAQLLPEPDKQPGYGYRWVRVSTLNTADPRNISSKMREGWEPVKAEEQPKLLMLVDAEGKFPGCVEIGGLVLCKMPQEMLDQRAEHFARKNNAQMDAVNNNLMRENDQRMPIFKEAKSERSFGTGNK